MKKIITILVLLTFCSAVANAESLTTLIQNDLASNIQKFYPAFQSAAKGLLYSLAVISLVINFGLMAVRGELEITGATAQLIKYALIVGFFSTLISSPSWFKNIFNAMNNLAHDAGGIGTLDEALDGIVKMWQTWWDYDFALDELANSLALFLVILIGTILIFLMIANALTIYAFFLLSVYIGIFWLGFGSYEQTRPWAINAIANVVRNGMKWVLSMLVISLAITSINQLNANLFAASGVEANLKLWMTFLGTSIVFWAVNSGIGGFVDSYFTGSGGGENSRGAQLVQTAMSAGAGAMAGGVAGGVAGAKGAADTISAAKATNGGSAGIGAGLKSGGQFLGGMASGMANGASKGVDGLAKDWASGSTPQPNKNKDWSNDSSSSAPQDGDVGGGTSGSIAEPKVGGEINKNQY